jgi:hypothetical protein
VALKIRRFVRIVLFRAVLSLADTVRWRRYAGAQIFLRSQALTNFLARRGDRHFKKLDRIAPKRRVESVANFLHISLAIAGILDAQIDRVFSGLEASSEAWSRFRDICNAYLLRYQDLSSLLCHDFLSKLTVRCPKKLAELPQFGEQCNLFGSGRRVEGR